MTKIDFFNRKMAKIDIFNRKMVQNDQNLGPGHGFERLQTGPPAQRQLVRGLAATSLQDPQKGSKMVKIRVKIGSLKVPPRSLQGNGLK